MRKLQLFLAAGAALTLLSGNAYAEELRFPVKDGEVLYTEDKTADITIDELQEMVKESTGTTNMYALDMYAHTDLSMAYGNDDSAMNLSMKMDIAMKYEKGDEKFHTAMGLDLSFLGQNLVEGNEEYTWKDENGNKVTVARSTNEDGVMSEWAQKDSDTEVSEEMVSIIGTDDSSLDASNIAGDMSDFELLDSMYKDENGDLFYVCRATVGGGKEPNETLTGLVHSMTAMSEELGIDIDDPAMVYMMFREEDGAFSKLYVDMGGLHGQMDGSALGSSEDAAFTFDALYMDMAYNDLEEDIVLPEELLVFTAKPETESEPETQEVRENEKPDSVNADDVSIAIDGEKYTLPVNVSKFIENGWEPEWEYSADEKLPAESFGYISLSKNGQSITVFTYNEKDTEVDLVESTVTNVSIGVFDQKMDVEILDGLVRIGMSDEQMKANLDEFHIAYEAEDPESGYQMFKIDLGDNKGYEVSAWDGIIQVVEATNEQGLWD